MMLAIAFVAAILSAWTSIGRDGTVSARIITRGACPPVSVNSKPLASTQRAAPSGAFAVRACEARIPSTAKKVSVDGRELPLPPLKVRTIAVFGDSGCRIELVFFQACNDPSKWPFPSLARVIAAEKPDLVIHLGDFYYRETACLISACAGSPHGDNWPTWQADFFGPAAPLFATAPLLAVRGNHESCARGGLGWERFLSSYPYHTCSEHEPAFATTVGGLRFFVIDSSNARDDRVAQRMLPDFQADFAGLRALPPKPTWLLTHRPLWGIGGTLTGGTLSINQTLEAAEKGAVSLPIELVLSGHIHLFEALRFADARPVQIVVGTGGDTLSAVPQRAVDQEIDGTTIAQATVRHDFGFALFDLRENAFSVYDRSGEIALVCRYSRTTVSCERH